MAWPGMKYVIIWVLFAGFFLTSQNVFSVNYHVTNTTLRGQVTNAGTGNPIIGAKITVNGNSTYSIIQGQYSMFITPPGSYTVSCTKAGFDAFTSATISFPVGTITDLNIQLQETAYPSPALSANLDTNQHVVNLLWEKPVGDYELLYDDGIEDSFTVWSQSGNMNALKFTPVSYPVSILGGSVNIGQTSDYPAGSNPLVTFQIVIMDAGGPGGTPLNILAGPLDVTPSGLGWVSFALSSAVSVQTGDFFIVMVQGGNAPNASGLAVDITSPKFRSFSKNISGSGAWQQANGNFMIRALVNGAGGPPSLLKSTDNSGSYDVWRLRQGEESNPQAWTFLATVNTNHLADAAWNNLPCGPYLWAVSARYPVNRLSAPALSNIIGKCWTAAVTVNLNMSCAASSPRGTFVQLRNLVYTDTLYCAYSDSSGLITFPRVWKGSYSVSAVKFAYQNYTVNISVTADALVGITLLQRKSPPANLRVDSLSLNSTWDVPYYNQTLLDEDWSGGSIPVSGWTIDGGNHWMISTSNGHPAPSAFFNWTPRIYNYSQSIVSPLITGLNSPILTLKFDLSLENFSPSASEQLAAEISTGTTWVTIKTWNNAGGDISWTREELDISAYANTMFRIRFRASGSDSYQINGWYIDNILIYASESAHLLSPCIYGYNFYLDNILLATVSSNSFTIPGTLVHYDSTYNACVLAIYTSGYSASDCQLLTSRFLWPPGNFHGTAMTDTALLQWDKPVYHIDTNYFTPLGLLGYNVYKDDSLLTFISGPDVLAYYDTGLDPGSYNYKVSAVYDLALYGHPAQQGHSVAVGPVNVQIHYGIPLPFSEPWNQGSFTYQKWTFPSGPGNWAISQAIGNPAPSAEFTGMPQQTAYNQILESPALDATQYSCASIWLDFDLKLNNITPTGTDTLILDVYYNRCWHQKAASLNLADTGWVEYHIDISVVKQKGFKFRFRASGQNSSDIQAWYIDNISVYPVCLPAENLSGEAFAMDVHLQWSPPQCNGGGNPMNQGFEEQDFPPVGWDRIISNTSATWSHTGISSPVGVHSGNYSAGLYWDYYHQDEWLIAKNIYVNGNLQFWSMAYQGSAHGDHYYVQVSTDQGQSWVTLLDMSALPPFPGAGGYNHWQLPYVVDMSSFLGDVVDIAWHAMDANSQGLWYYWAIDDCTMGGKKIPISQDQPYYDVYRKSIAGTDFLKINTSPVLDTAFIDVNLPEGGFKYYIQIVNPVCTLSLSSDTITIDVITSVQQSKAQGVISIYPNPASDWVRIRSDSPVISAELLNILGEAMFEFNLVESKEPLLSLSGIPPGLYFLKVLTRNSCRNISLIVQ